MDADLRSIQQAREHVRKAAAAQHRHKVFDQDATDRGAAPMGAVAALIPSTNPTSTAMYKAIIAAKARW